MIAESEVAAYASGTAFFLFLSIIPMIMLVSGLLPETVVRKGMVNISQAVIPEKVYNFLAGVAAGCRGENMTLVSVSAAVVVWSASKGVLALIRGLNHIYDIDESRNYLMLRLKAAFYTVFLLTAILLSFGLLVFGDIMADLLVPDSGWLASLWGLLGSLRHIFVAGLISVVFCTMYCLLPNSQPAWPSQYPGAAFTSVFWTLYSFAFSVYVDYFDGFDMYGNLTTIIIVMIWLYFCMYIFFCGALINVLLNKQL